MPSFAPDRHRAGREHMSTVIVLNGPTLTLFGTRDPSVNLSPAAAGIVVGFGIDGYALAIDGLGRRAKPETTRP